MDVELFLAADYANIDQMGKLNVMGIFREIYAPSFPAKHSSMFIIVGLKAQLGEYGTSRLITIKILDPDGKEILNFKKQVDIPKGQGGRRPEVNVIVGVRDLVFPEPNTYQLVLQVDSDTKSEFPLYVSLNDQK